MAAQTHRFHIPSRIVTGVGASKFAPPCGIRCGRRMRQRIEPGGLIAAQGGVNVNVLKSKRISDLGGGATFYTNCVQVGRVFGPPPNVPGHSSLPM